MLFVGVGCCAISVSIVQQDLFSFVLCILRHLKSIEGIFQPTKGKMPMFTILWGVELLFLVHWKFVYSVILNHLILIYDILNFPLTLLWTHFRNKATIRSFDFSMNSDLPFCVLVWPGADLYHSFCSRGRKRCIGSGRFHPSATEELRSRRNWHTPGPLKYRRAVKILGEIA